jgi:hypothetical protein
MEHTACPGQLNLIHGRNDSGTVRLEYAASSMAGKPQFSLTMDGAQVFPPMTEEGQGTPSRRLVVSRQLGRRHAVCPAALRNPG